MKKLTKLIGLAIILSMTVLACSGGGNSDDDLPPAGTGSGKELIDTAIDFLIDGKYDEGIAKITEAYNAEQTDTTKLYYSLAQIALISTDPDMVSLMRNNFGFPNYPDKLNALIDGKWLNTSNYNAISAIFSGNKNGFDSAIATVLNTVSKTYTTIKPIAASMSESSVVLPPKAIEAFNLTEFLGDSDIYVGKAELNAVLAVIGILKGELEYISAYNWEINAADYANTQEGDVDIDKFVNVIWSGTKLFTTKNANALTASKATFIEAIDLVISSYDYISGNSTTYPAEAKDALNDYKILRDAAVALKSAIENGTDFYIVNPEDYKDSSWPTTKPNDDDLICTIKFGNLFTPNIWSTLLEKNSEGNVKVELEYSYYIQGSTQQYEVIAYSRNSDSVEITKANTYAKAKENIDTEFTTAKNDTKFDSAYNIYESNKADLYLILGNISSVIDDIDFSGEKLFITNVYDEWKNYIKNP